MKKLAVLAVGLMALALTSVAHAEYYIGVGAGAVILEDPKTDFTFNNRTLNCGIGVEPCVASPVIGPPGGDPTVKLKTDLGWGVNLSAGYAGLFIPEFRVEGELAYRLNHVSKVTESPATFPCFTGSCPGTGHMDSFAIMANGYYDFLNSSQFTPYLGVGAGAARVSLNDVGITSPFNFTASASDWKFAYQGIAGVRYTINPTWSVNLDYRYFATLDPKFDINFFGFHTTQKMQYHTHNIFLGLAYHIVPPPPAPPVAVAPPPPPVAPPPAAAKQFVVYFEFDKSNLTPEGAKVVSDAAAAFRAGGSAQVAVSGYTDLAGTQQYNIGLSKRRADTVRAGLVKAGVPNNVISESWHGKENPAVPTPDGVREPRNRRVEIML